MIRVSLQYAESAGRHFDFSYYCDRHLPLMRRRLGNACRALSLERGFDGLYRNGLAPCEQQHEGLGSPLLVVHLYFDNLQSFQQAVTPCREEILADLAKCTDIVPEVSIQEVDS